MFSSITSYLFGAVEPETEDVTSKQPEQEAKTDHQPKAATTLETRQDEDEWILVEKSGTSKMETSSMENLLIEHPSMSVYHHRGRQSSAGIDSDNSESSNDDESSDQRTQYSQAGLARHEPQHRPRALTAHVNLAQVKTIRYMQKAQQRQLYKNLSHNNMRRSNLTHHSQGKVTRRHMVQQPRTRQIAGTKQC